LRDLLWGGIGDEFKFHLIGLRFVHRRFRAGGGGVRSEKYDSV